ncbi:MAG: leucine-rich repeat domain-containing protein [Lentimicrobiaceae bacterium]|nr:leucine-rich repeat domain-containing protein [Lentimicrobiaceae bacterium]
MKRLLFLMGMFLTFASFGYAETKIDTIWFDIKPDTVGEDVTATLQYCFAKEIEDNVTWEWVSAKGIQDGDLEFFRDEEIEEGRDEDKRVVKTYTVHRQIISDTGRMYIYYSHEDTPYSLYLSTGNTRSLFDIKILTDSKRIITALDASDCATLDALDCRSNLLESLNISGCTALKSLQCDMNQLHSLDLSENTALTRLTCYNNQLETLNVSRLTSLTVLQCYFNQLTSLDVSGNTNLKELDCSSNKLEHLDVSNHIFLKNLRCEKNELKSLNVKDCDSLLDLYCSSNKLEMLDISGCKFLKNIYCWGNQLTTLNATGFDSLSRLHCYSNQLTSLDVSNNPTLNELDCSSNQLTSLNTSNCTALRILNCDKNQLERLDVSGCTQLPKLSCNDNRLIELNVSGCTSLTEIKCIGNQLQTLDVSACVALTSLYCDNNKLKSLDVSACTNLLRLYCDSNQLTELKVKGCTGLNVLYCESNQLTRLDVSGCAALSALYCNNNQLTSIDVSDCDALKVLHCANNRFTELDLGRVPALTDLYCYGNQMERLDVSGCTALNALRCQDNRLDTLDISHNTAIRQLFCSNNRMPLSVLYKIYTQIPNWYNFNASGQSDSIIWPVVQSLDLSSERILGDSLSVYTMTNVSGQILSSAYYTEEDFNFHFNKEQGYILTMMNPNVKIQQPNDTVINENNDTILNGTLISFTWHILAEMPEGYFSVQVASNNNDWGTAAIAGDSVVVGNDRYYQAGTSVTIRATVKEDYLFVNWTDKDGQVFSTEAEYTFEVTEDLELTANFRKNEFTVRVTTSNSAWGVVSMIGSGTYAYGEEATIIATPREGYRFVDWKKDDGEVFSTEAEYPFKVTEDLHLTAYFKKREIVTVELSVNNPEWGSVSQSGSGTYEEDDEVTITATPIEGYHFVNWTKGGAVFSTESKHTFTVTEDLELTAVFAQDAANENRQDDSFYVYAQDRNIILSENRGEVKVFNAAGQCVYSGNATLIPVRRSGLYLVRVGISSYKVIVR